MTVSSTNNKNRHEGNGVTTAFSFTGRLFSSGDLVVQRLTRATDAVVDTLTLTTDYTVTLTGAQSATVTITNASKIPSALQDLLIYRSVAQTQTLDLPTGTRFPAVSVENAIDKMVVIAQDLQEQLDRKIGVDISDSDGAPTVTELLSDIEAAQDACEAAQTAAELAETNAETAASTATTQAGIATAAAAGVSLPTLGTADTVLQVNAGGTALEYAKINAANITDAGITVAKLTSGAATDGQVLTADGAGGAAFETLVIPSFDGLPNSGYITNRYYTAPGSKGSGSTLVVTADRLYSHVFAVGASVTFTRIGIYVTSGAGNARFGIYNMVDGNPTTLVADLGTVSTAGTGEIELTISQALTQGIYALGVVFSGTPTVRIPATGDTALFYHYIGQSAGTNSADQLGVYTAHTYGALPSPFGSVTYATSVPVIWMRKV